MILSTMELVAFVFAGAVEGEEVEGFSEAAAEAVSIGGLELCGAEVGGDVGEHAVFYEEVVAGEENLCHDVAFVAIVFEAFFGTQVVEADGPGFFVIETVGAVTVYDVVAVFDEFEVDIPAGFHDVLGFYVGDEA